MHIPDEPKKERSETDPERSGLLKSDCADWNELCSFQYGFQLGLEFLHAARSSQLTFRQAHGPIGRGFGSLKSRGPRSV
ncbi:MAG: hypothetical protein E7029_09820 [Planctomycetaceae bacterium]|nr:hypothetical protein [Planctomycetaceae bacterium]